MTGRRQGRFGAIATAMVTPFDENGKLDLDGARQLANHLITTGSEALVVAGTTGEAPVLSDSERRDLWHAVAEISSVPVIAGSTTNDTAHSVEMTRAAEAAGVAGILAVTPYYSRPSQVGIARHFTAVAEATALPVMIYDIPVRTGRKVSTETLLRLARETRNILGVKDAAGDVAGSARLMAEAPAGFDLYSGEDSLTLPLLAVGAVGAVSVASHWIGPELATMVGAYLAGEVETARQLNADLIDAVAFQSSDEAPNPLPAKAMMRALGLPSGDCRLPHGPAPGWLEERAEAVLADLETWRAGRAGA
jgi:4-hydroxy-tetrahydrodipicolinate synthase